MLLRGVRHGLLRADASRALCLRRRPCGEDPRSRACFTAVGQLSRAFPKNRSPENVRTGAETTCGLRPARRGGPGI